MIMGVLGTIDAGLKALEIPHGRGALEAAAQVIAAAGNAQVGRIKPVGAACCG